MMKIELYVVGKILTTVSILSLMAVTWSYTISEYKTTDQTKRSEEQDPCSLSDEARKIKLVYILKKVCLQAHSLCNRIETLDGVNLVKWVWVRDCPQMTSTIFDLRAMYRPFWKLRHSRSCLVCDVFSEEVYCLHIKQEYYENNRHMSPTNVEFSDKEVKQYYTPYIPSPENLKRNADKAKNLLNMIKNLKYDSKLLKPREDRLLYQFQYFLESNFDNVYANYYDGVYMLGPDYFCEQTICFVSNNLMIALKRIKVKTLKDLELIIFWIKEHRKTFSQYQKNVKEGVAKGMVQSIEVCKASSKTFAKKYRRVYFKGAIGASEMDFAKLLNSTAYYKDLPKAVYSDFKRKHGASYFKLMNDVIKDDFGQPLKELIDYLRHEHIRYCVSSNTSSGLGGLPLEYQYKDGAKQNRTLPKLPSGEDIDVTKGYQKFMRYYTTSNISGSEAMDLGYKLVSRYYKEVLKLGREITKKQDEEEMKEEFQTILKSQKQFYNSKPFPKNESDDDAHDRCDNDIDAKKFCPNRWSTLQDWFSENTRIMKEAKSSFKDLFYHSGPRKTTPNCLVQLVPEYNPTNGVPSYMESDPECSEPAQYFLPFFKNNMGPRYEDYNTNFHEARPGHHLQIQGYMENFADLCPGITSWINEIVDYYPSFSEGWGLYAENPILMNDTNVLTNDDKLERYGVLKWQIWRALRLIVDVGIHEKNMTRDQAMALFSKYAWDDSDTTLKELTRYQGTPGQATSYTVGQQTIIELRNRAKANLGDKFNMKDFHYYLLSQGQSPFFFVSKYIDMYIGCTKDKSTGKYCSNILSDSGRERKRSLTTEEKQIASFFRMFKKKKHS